VFRDIGHDNCTCLFKSNALDQQLKQVLQLGEELVGAAAAAEQDYIKEAYDHACRQQQGEQALCRTLLGTSELDTSSRVSSSESRILQVSQILLLLKVPACCLLEPMLAARVPTLWCAAAHILAMYLRMLPPALHAARPGVAGSTSTNTSSSTSTTTNQVS
jgi:hypothetical protein